MGNSFKMKDMDEIQEFLGIQVHRGKDYIELHQEKYTTKLVEKFRQENCKPTRIPMAKIYEADQAEQIEARYPVREEIGSLTWPTRQDLIFLSR